MKAEMTNRRLSFLIFNNDWSEERVHLMATIKIVLRYSIKL